MKRSMRYSLSTLLLSAIPGVAANNDGLKNIEHIVLFMQENRAFDEYFGTMAGVRGFMDPNVQVNSDGRTVFEQPLVQMANQSAAFLKPWHAAYPGGEYIESVQCATSGSNGWDAMHKAWNWGSNNGWANDTPTTWSYLKRSDVPVQFDIAEGWTTLDMATESVMAATDPNRVFWVSGTVNTPGSPSNLDGTGGMILDDNATPGCEESNVNCYPFTWKTFPEYLEDAGISWQLYQDFDNWEDNPLAYFSQYQNAPNTSAIKMKGDSYPGIQKFYDDAKAGTLPQISYIVGPQELSEHPPNRPVDGAWLQKNVVDAVTSSPLYPNMALFIMYDEEGGYGDHVTPFLPPNGTAGEWIDNPFDNYTNWIPIGPGYRVPSYIISPWTRGGNVFTEHVDHSSEILFVEAWAEAHGYEGVYCEALGQWRRDHMSNLICAFDFTQNDTSVPTIATVPTPVKKAYNASDYTGNFTLGSNTGDWVGPAKCLSQYAKPNPPTPFGEENMNQNLSLVVEEGFKRVRGRLTEGRYLTVESQGQALSNLDGKTVGVSPCTSKHDDVRQRWVIHAQDYDSDVFTVSSALDGQYISSILGQLTNDSNAGQKLKFEYCPDGATYSVCLGTENTASLEIGTTTDGLGMGNSTSGTMTKFEIFSVSYHG